METVAIEPRAIAIDPGVIAQVGRPGHRPGADLRFRPPRPMPGESHAMGGSKWSAAGSLLPPIHLVPGLAIPQSCLCKDKHKSPQKRDTKMSNTTTSPAAKNTATRTAGTTWDSFSRTAGTTWDSYSRTPGTTWD